MSKKTSPADSFIIAEREIDDHLSGNKMLNGTKESLMSNDEVKDKVRSVLSVMKHEFCAEDMACLGTVSWQG